MIVGFDLTWMNAKNTAGGVFQYASSLITALVEYTEAEVVVFVGPEGIGVFDNIKNRRNFRVVLRESSSSVAELVNTNKIEVIHTPVQRHLNYTLAVPMITTLHDLQQFHYPEFFSEGEIRHRNTYYKKAADFSERVIVSYDHVKEDVIKFYDISPQKIEVCPVGMPEPRPVDRERDSEVRTKYHIQGSYLFYAANTWRHKNHVRLLQALKLLHDKYGIRPSLICTGYKYDDYYPEIQKVIDDLGLSEFVNFTGYVPEEDLRLLLLNAALVVIPTLYEAGSFPLMEAMVYNVPVICSSVTSLPETIGDPRFVFDPNDVDQMSDKIASMLSDSALLEENKRNSAKRVKEVSWRIVVRNFLNAYAGAIESFKDKKRFAFYKDWLVNYDYFASEEINSLRNRLEVAEADRAARLEVIERQGQEFASRLSECEADRAARLEVIKRLGKELYEKSEEFGRKMEEMDDELRSREAEIEALRMSYSWLITEPVRWIARKLGVKGRQ